MALVSSRLNVGALWADGGERERWILAGTDVKLKQKDLHQQQRILFDSTTHRRRARASAASARELILESRYHRAHGPKSKVKRGMLSQPMVTSKLKRSPEALGSFEADFAVYNDRHNNSGKEIPQAIGLPSASCRPDMIMPGTATLYGDMFFSWQQPASISETTLAPVTCLSALA